MSRILPQDFHALYVERLASFFIALRETLVSIAPRNRDNPRVVLLSPGTRSATYFEDGYLSRYLGYSLAEGGDLTVRGSQVFLKTLGGLLPVDVILRRVPDEESDPLELKADSQLGVPGLVEAVREGQVAVANSLGSGFLEAPALMAYLPEICRALRSEELELPSAGTWWCGRPDHLQYVESHLHELVIRPAFRHRSVAPILGWRLTQAEKNDLLARIRHHPGAFVGQAQIVRSTAPVWNDSRLEPWRLGLAHLCRRARRGLPRDARRPLADVGPRRFRGRVALRRRSQQRRLGPGDRPRQKRDAAQADARRPSSSAAAATTCPAVRPTTSSGSAGLWSGPNGWSATSAAPSCG